MITKVTSEHIFVSRHIKNFLGNRAPDIFLECESHRANDQKTDKNLKHTEMRRLNRFVTII